MPDLKIYLLGPPRAELDGQDIQVDTRKAIALLAYLAMGGQAQTRDHLAYLFWPDFDTTRARAALRRTLSALKKALQGAWLSVDRNSIGLERGPGFCLDVEQFRALVSESESHPNPDLKKLSAAADLYRDDFLSGFTLRDSLGFDEWQRYQEEVLRRELDLALERIVQGYTTQADFTQALIYARRWSSLDPLREEAHRQLMRLYAWEGQRNAALQQYRVCVRVLEEELGVPPLEETTALYELIKENPELPAPTPETSPVSAAPEVSEGLEPQRGEPIYPLVGREIAWQTLREAYGRIQTDGHLMLIEGEIGIGKTRLVEEFLEVVQSCGGRMIQMRCYEGESGLAYAPFVDGIRRVIADSPDLEWLQAIPDHGLSDAARLIPEILGLRPNLPEPMALDGPGAQIRFLESLSQLIRGICAGPVPGVLLLDDAQWADEASLDLLVYLARRLEGRPIGILIAQRDEGVGAGRLPGLVSEIQRKGIGTRIKLTRLQQEDVRQLAESFAGPALEEASVQRLYEESDGIPFFVVEYLQMLTTLDAQDAASPWSLPGGIRDLLHSRLVGLDETSQQLLSTAAVIGRSFDFDALRVTSGRSEEETVNGLEVLSTAGLFAEVEPDKAEGGLIYDFRHEKMRSLVYAETSLARRRLLHRRVAEALVDRPRLEGLDRGALAGQIASHFRLAGDDLQAGDYYIQAGIHDRDVFANAEAVAHFEAALAMGAGDPTELYEWIAELQTLMGKYREALRSYETAAAHSPTEHLPTLEHKLGTVHHRLGEWELAESYYQSSLSALGDGGSLVEQAGVYADWSLSAHRQGRSDQAEELAGQALKLAESAGEARALAQAYNLSGILARGRGDLEAARGYLDQSLAQAAKLNDLGARVAALNNLAHVDAEAGEISRAQTSLEEALQLCIQMGDRHREAALENNLADLSHRAGQPEAAMEHLKTAVAIFAEIGGEEGTLQPEIWMLEEW